METISDRINILHLSDVHLSKTKEYDIGVVSGALRKDLEALSRTPFSPQIVVFSGDLANDADDLDAYLLAEEMLLGMVLQSTGIPNEHFFFVPGIHDVQRSAYLQLRPEFDALYGLLKDREALNDFVGRPETRALAENKFCNFSAFANVFEPDNCLYDDFFVKTFRFADAPLCLLLVNTAWMSTAGIGREDRGNLLVAEKSLYQAIKAAGTNKKILVGHHPISWLADHSAFDVQTLIDQEINIYLHGHMHKADPRATQAALGRTYLNQSGALFTSRKMWNGYSIVSLSLSSEHIQTYFRSYFDERKAFGVGEDITPRVVCTIRHRVPAPSGLITRRGLTTVCCMNG
jgi:Calcineurin-like phosphoesterase